MIDQKKFESILEAYKKDFEKRFNGNKGEKFKWEAVETFRKNWDINAPNFGEMFKNATKKAVKLLGSGPAYCPRDRIIEFAEADNETTRQMFRDLYDESESVDLTVRVDRFQTAAKELYIKYELYKKHNGDKKNHCQDAHAITTYLWLRFPDEYYIYKEKCGSSVEHCLVGGDELIKGSMDNKLYNFNELYDEMRTYIKNDTELLQKLEDNRTVECYKDPEYRTLTIDVGYYICEQYGKTNDDESITNNTNDIENSNTINNQKRSYWWLVDDPEEDKKSSKKSISDAAIDEPIYRSTLSPKGNKSTGYENYHQLKVGDVAIGYESYPIKQIVAICKITEEVNKNTEEFQFIKIVHLENKIDFSTIQSRLPNMDFVNGKSVRLQTLDKNEYDTILDLIMEKNPEINKQNINNKLVIQQNMQSKKNEQERVKGGANILYYGVPGSGKSYAINNQIGENERKERMERVIFHPDYTYSDFVGQILPKLVPTKDKSDEKKLTYEFVPGPFTRILKKAIKHPENMYYLVIEEINRGNAPAIFGDIFQLLDRNENGSGEYPITNSDILDYINKDKGPDENKKLEDENEKSEKVEMPSNLTIYATMNTSDQNVFTLDTAFQRRWDMQLVLNNFDNMEDPLLKPGTDTKIEGTNISWRAFATTINEAFLSTATIVSSEDKRLGVHFVNKSELKADKFPQKVLKYLWDDAFRMNRETIFNDKMKSLEDIITKYNSEIDKGKKVVENDPKGHDPLAAILKDGKDENSIYRKMLDTTNEEDGNIEKGNNSSEKATPNEDNTQGDTVND